MQTRRVFFLLYLVYSLLASTAVYLHRDRGIASIYELYFGFGPLVESLVKENRYAAEYPPESVFGGTVWRAHRMPLVPLVLAAVGKVSSSVFPAYMVKNVLFAAPLWIALYLFFTRAASVALWARVGLLAFALSMPPLLNASFPLDVEEAYLTSLVAVLFAGLLFVRPEALTARTWRSGLLLCGLGACLALLYLTKSSVLLVCLAFAALYVFRTRSARVGIVLGGMLGAAILAWGLHTVTATGSFSVSSSWNGWNFYKGNNERTAELYPPHNLDVLDWEGWTRPPEEIRDEWALDAYYFDLGRSYVRAHVGETVAMAFKRAFVLLLEVRNSPTNPGEARITGKAQAIAVVYMVLFRVLLLTCVGASLFCLVKTPGPLRWGSLCFLVLLAAYCPPYLVGFAYERHVMPLVWPTVFYLAWLAQHLRERREAERARLPANTVSVS